ncbi:MAG TPA: chromate efflux transporter [Chitinophagaceae bacterium]|nr:chromate efflux transporter [Chitinophagaceae bacterium]
MKERNRLYELVTLFLKLGIIGFGGPAAHIAMMQDEVVHKRKWLTEQRFLDLVGATNLIPGPNSTEMAIHIGQERAGWKGLMIAGVCFIVPAVLLTGIIAVLYSKYGQLPAVQPFIYGIKPAIIAIILAAVFPLAKRAARSTMMIMLGILVFVLYLAGISEILLMFGAGSIALAGEIMKRGRRSGRLHSILPLTFLQVVQPITFLVTNTKLFLVFLKIGAILYGSGYVLFAFIDTELVQTGLLSRQQLIDAIAVGQFTPGPVFSAVTFIGYLLNGIPGALVATIAIFLPAFLFVALLNPLVKRLRDSTRFAVFLDAVNIASVALIAGTCVIMGKETITEWRSVTIACLALLVTFGFSRINSAWIVIGGSLVGYFLSWL